MRHRLKEIAFSRPRYGYRRLFVLLRREGWRCNVKLVHRLYREEGLSIRTKYRQKRAAATRVPLEVPTGRNERWTLDFVVECC